MEGSKLSDSVFLQWDVISSVLKAPKKTQKLEKLKQKLLEFPISCRRHMCCVPVLNWSQFGTELQNDTCVYQSEPYKSVATLLSRPSRVRRRILNSPQESRSSLSTLMFYLPSCQASPDRPMDRNKSHKKLLVLFVSST